MFPKWKIENSTRNVDGDNYPHETLKSQSPVHILDKRFSYG